MSSQERSNLVSLTCTVVLLGFYLLNIAAMTEDGSLGSVEIFSLWATVIILGILTQVLAQIIAQIVAAIIIMIQTKEEPDFISDERDKLIDLKGVRNSYVVYTLTVLAAMIMLAVGESVPSMFNVLVLAGLFAQIFGDVSRLYMYWRGA